MAVSRRNAFTIVELLVVIVIMSVLAAMLFPTMEQALEKGQRLRCLGQERQMHLQITCYASDWQDRLPYQAHLETWGSVSNGETYWAPAHAPIRYFLNLYLGVNMPIDQILNAGAFTDRNALVCCPSRRPEAFNGGRIHYGFPGFGIFNLNNPAKSSYGTTRLSLVARRIPITQYYPTAPILPFAMITDMIPYAPAQEPGLNHGLSGGNVIGGDGAGQWLDYENWASGDSGQNAPSRLYYTQWSYGSGFWGPPETGAATWKMYYSANRLLGYRF